jgi:hypothetical protein
LPSAVPQGPIQQVFVAPRSPTQTFASQRDSRTSSLDQALRRKTVNEEVDSGEQCELDTPGEKTAPNSPSTRSHKRGPSTASQTSISSRSSFPLGYPSETQIGYVTQSRDGDFVAKPVRKSTDISERPVARAAGAPPSSSKSALHHSRRASNTVYAPSPLQSVPDSGNTVVERLEEHGRKQSITDDKQGLAVTTDPIDDHPALKDAVVAHEALEASAHKWTLPDDIVSYEMPLSRESEQVIQSVKAAQQDEASSPLISSPPGSGSLDANGSTERYHFEPEKALRNTSDVVVTEHVAPGMSNFRSVNAMEFVVLSHVLFVPLRPDSPY